MEDTQCLDKFVGRCARNQSVGGGHSHSFEMHVGMCYVTVVYALKLNSSLGNTSVFKIACQLTIQNVQETDRNVCV